MADDNETHFPIIGEKYLSSGNVKQSSVGEAKVALFSMQDLVHFAVRYFESVL